MYEEVLAIQNGTEEILALVPAALRPVRRMWIVGATRCRDAP